MNYDDAMPLYIPPFRFHVFTMQPWCTLPLMDNAKAIIAVDLGDITKEAGLQASDKRFVGSKLKSYETTVTVADKK